MNKKFFGNSLDLFKFDVISYLCGAKHIYVKNIEEERKAPRLRQDMYLYYVSMITPFLGFPKENKVYKAYQTGEKNTALISFLIERYRNEAHEIREIRTHFNEADIEHLLLLDNELGFFCNETRKEYFQDFVKLYDTNQNKRVQSTRFSRLHSSLVFIDPDNGFIDKTQSGFRRNRNGYLLANDILDVRNNIVSSDVLGFFQILDKKKVTMLDRKDNLENKIDKPTVTIFDWSIKASLVFVLENEEQQIKLKEKLEEYLIDYPNIGTEMQRGVI